MVYGENRRQVQEWGKIARVALLILVITVAVASSGTKEQWIKIPGENIIARIWFSASLFTTLVFTCWLNYVIAVTPRYSTPMLAEKHKGPLMIINTSVLIYTILCISLILAGVIEDTWMLSVVGGPVLVVLILLFDMRVLKMEEAILDKEPKIQENIKACETAKAIVRHLDLPILIGVSTVSLICIILNYSSIGLNYPSFTPGFASGATGMQIIVANVAFEFIHT